MGHDVGETSQNEDAERSVVIKNEVSNKCQESSADINFVVFSLQFLKCLIEFECFENPDDSNCCEVILIDLQPDKVLVYFE